MLPLRYMLDSAWLLSGQRAPSFYSTILRSVKQREDLASNKVMVICATGTMNNRSLRRITRSPRGVMPWASPCTLVPRAALGCPAHSGTRPWVPTHRVGAGVKSTVGRV